LRKTERFSYCLEAVQRPVQPSDRTNEPEPPRPEKRPELVQLRPWTDPPLLVAPLGLTDPELKSPERLPPEMTNLSVLLPQGVPTATEEADLVDAQGVTVARATAELRVLARK